MFLFACFFRSTATLCTFDYEKLLQFSTVVMVIWVAEHAKVNNRPKLRRIIKFSASTPIEMRIRPFISGFSPEFETQSFFLESQLNRLPSTSTDPCCCWMIEEEKKWVGNNCCLQNDWITIAINSVGNIVAR